MSPCWVLSLVSTAALDLLHKQNHSSKCCVDGLGLDRTAAFQLRCIAPMVFSQVTSRFLSEKAKAMEGDAIWPSVVFERRCQF